MGAANVLTAIDDVLSGGYSGVASADENGNVLERIQNIANSIGAGVNVMSTVDNIAQNDGSSGTPTSEIGLSDSFTITNPGTTKTTVFDVSGAGFILGLSIHKPSTANSVNIRVELTIDGVTVVNDVAIGSSSTGVRDYLLVGGVDGRSAAIFTGPMFLPFKSQAKLAVRFTGTPGASEDITGRFVVVYS